MHKAVHLLSVRGADTRLSSVASISYDFHARICGIPALSTRDVPLFLFKIAEVRR